GRRARVHDRGDTPPRHRDDPRPGGDRHPGGPPLRPARYEVLRRAGDRAGLLLALQHGGGGRRARSGRRAVHRGLCLMSNVSELYQQVILDHNKKPRNFRRIDEPSRTAEGYNPLCGDQLTVFLKLDEAGTIEDVSFEGTGCAISKAAASMMTVAVKGKPV